MTPIKQGLERTGEDLCQAFFLIFLIKVQNKTFQSLLFIENYELLLFGSLCLIQLQPNIENRKRKY